MRHRVKTNRLGRFSSLRKATINSLARAIIINQSVRTTLAKARAAVPVIEHLINLSRKGTLQAKRESFKILTSHRLVAGLFAEIALLFKDRPSGYTKIIKLGKRRGDGAQMVILELTEKSKKEKRQKKEKTTTAVTGEPHIKPEDKAYPKKEERPKEVEKKKPYPKKFLGGLRGFFKKERDSL